MTSWSFSLVQTPEYWKNWKNRFINEICTKANLCQLMRQPQPIPSQSYHSERLWHFNYLGVCETKIYTELFKCNFSPLLARLSQDVHRWSLLPMSLAGRINCIKMNVLKLFYLFQGIPIFLPKNFNLHSLDTSISQFIWNKSTTRIKK